MAVAKGGTSRETPPPTPSTLLLHCSKASGLAPGTDRSHRTNFDRVLRERPLIQLASAFSFFSIMRCEAAHAVARDAVGPVAVACASFDLVHRVHLLHAWLLPMLFSFRCLGLEECLYLTSPLLTSSHLHPHSLTRCHGHGNGINFLEPWSSPSTLFLLHHPLPHVR